MKKRDLSYSELISSEEEENMIKYLSESSDLTIDAKRYLSKLKLRSFKRKKGIANFDVDQIVSNMLNKYKKLKIYNIFTQSEIKEMEDKILEINNLAEEQIEDDSNVDIDDSFKISSNNQNENTSSKKKTNENQNTSQIIENYKNDLIGQKFLLKDLLNPSIPLGAGLSIESKETGRTLRPYIFRDKIDSPRIDLLYQIHYFPRALLANISESKFHPNQKTTIVQPKPQKKTNTVNIKQEIIDINSEILNAKERRIREILERENIVIDYPLTLNVGQSTIQIENKTVNLIFLIQKKKKKKTNHFSSILFN